jgi:hypothetical protein
VWLRWTPRASLDALRSDTTWRSKTVATPPEDLQRAAEGMIRECIQQIDASLADSSIDLAPPNHPLDVWRDEKSKQVLVMTGTLNGTTRFDAVCVFTLNGKGSVTLHFKTGSLQDKRCLIPTCRADESWRVTLDELHWDDEAT